jgi:hypothetical protein
MRTTIITALLLAAPVSAFAWGGSDSSGMNNAAAAQQARQGMLERNATWRQRLQDRVDGFLRNRFGMQSPLRTNNPGINSPLKTPATEATQALKNRPQLIIPPAALSPAAKKSLTGARSPWTVTGGFGDYIRRAGRFIGQLAFRTPKKADTGSLIARATPTAGMRRIAPANLRAEADAFKMRAREAKRAGDRDLAQRYAERADTLKHRAKLVTKAYDRMQDRIKRGTLFVEAQSMSPEQRHSVFMRKAAQLRAQAETLPPALRERSLFVRQAQLLERVATFSAKDYRTFVNNLFDKDQKDLASRIRKSIKRGQERADDAQARAKKVAAAGKPQVSEKPATEAPRFKVVAPAPKFQLKSATN